MHLDDNPSRGVVIEDAQIAGPDGPDSTIAAKLVVTGRLPHATGVAVGVFNGDDPPLMMLEVFDVKNVHFSAGVPGGDRVTASQLLDADQCRCLAALLLAFADGTFPSPSTTLD